MNVYWGHVKLSMHRDGHVKSEQFLTKLFGCKFFGPLLHPHNTSLPKFAPRCLALKPKYVVRRAVAPRARSMPGNEGAMSRRILVALLFVA